jgi:hypothetical protein
MGLMAWSSGASHQLINVLNHACLSMSYTTINDIIKALADRSIEDARQIAARPHAIAYDNINFSGSIYAEQTPNSMSKVLSGSFSVIYEVDAKEEDVQVAPMMKNLLNSSPLTMSDLRASEKAMKSYLGQTAVNISKILFKNIDGFADYRGHRQFQNILHRQLPPGHKTRFYPLRASTIEEASIPGNLLVHDDIYLV